MVKLWQVLNIVLKRSHRRSSVKKAVLKHWAILIEKYLCWSLFSINLQAYKSATLLQTDSNTGLFLWILQNFKNLFFKGHLWTTASELHWFKVKEMIFIFQLYFIFTLLPCPETLITNWKHVSFISNWFTLVAEYI